MPAEVPYISADEARLKSWSSRIRELAGDARLKVGIVWAGNVKPDAARTCPLENLAPLAQFTEVAFFSLQKGEAAAEASSPPGGMRLTSLSDELKDFADTAAAMQNMDLILTIDTAAAHLAGALGRPTWTMLPYVADWRWLEDRADSPWYPTMRLFRQRSRGDWPGVVAQIIDSLRDLIAKCG